MKNAYLLAAAALWLSGCTTTPKSFYAHPHEENVPSLCRALAKSGNQKFRNDIIKELESRGVTTAAQCRKRVNAENAVLAGIAIAGIAAVSVAACKNGGCSGGGYSTPTYDEVAWDEFYIYGQPTWRCRSETNGQFVADYQCAYKPKVDTTWPSPYS